MAKPSSPWAPPSARLPCTPLVRTSRLLLADGASTWESASFLANHQQMVQAHPNSGDLEPDRALPPPLPVHAPGHQPLPSVGGWMGAPLFVSQVGMEEGVILPSLCFPQLRTPPGLPSHRLTRAKAKVSSHPGPLHPSPLWPHL